jgi:hypothetical protein
MRPTKGGMNMFTESHKSIFAASIALVAVLASSIPAAAQSSYSLRMENNTGYSIYEVHMSSVHDGSWESDLLGSSRVFWYGTSFTITQITPGHYDMEFVDEDADVCVLHNVAVYSNLDWDLTRGWLLNCEHNTER